jgi:hypothetical protein
METPQKPDPWTNPKWHDPEELKDRLNQPKVSYEEALAQTRRMMSAPQTDPPAPPTKKTLPIDI